MKYVEFDVSAVLHCIPQFLKYFLAQWGIIIIFSPLRRPQPVEDEPSPSSSWVVSSVSMSDTPNPNAANSIHH